MDNDGGSTVLVRDGCSEWVLAHELLHVAYHRRGWPRAMGGADPNPVWDLMVTMPQDVIVHPLMMPELVDRGFDDQPEWAAAAARISDWTPAPNRLSAFSRAIQIVGVVRAAPDDVAREARRRCRECHPQVWRSVPTIRAMTSPANVKTPRRARLAAAIVPVDGAPPNGPAPVGFVPKVDSGAMRILGLPERGRRIPAGSSSLGRSGGGLGW